MSMSVLSDNEIPEAIAQTNPAFVTVYKGRVRIEYGDSHWHFGLGIPYDGFSSSHSKKIQEGIYFYEYTDYQWQ